MVNERAGPAEGRLDFTDWDRAVLSVPCTLEVTPEWIDDARLRIALTAPPGDAWSRVHWRSRDEARNVDVSVVIANLP